MRRLDLVVGSNGAGKTTFVTQRLQPLLIESVFVNADVIAAEEWPDAAAEHSYEAARIAARMRTTLITLGESFIAETVFSHKSKLDLIEEALRHDYTVILHVMLVPEELTVERVRQRVLEGGHLVPEDKIRERYHRLWDLVAIAITRCDSATVYDNSAADITRIVARFSEGEAVGTVAWPRWTPAPLRDRWPSTS